MQYQFAPIHNFSFSGSGYLNFYVGLLNLLIHKPMKKIIMLSVTAFLLMSFTLPLGDCDKMFFFKEGTSTTMTSYNEDGKITGSSKTLYSKVIKSADGITLVTANQENYDKKGKLASKSEFGIKCQNGTIYFDMKMMLPQQQAESGKGMEMTMEGTDMEMPSDIAVGAMLKDANVKFVFKTNEGMPMPMMNMSVNVTNRKVEAKETITTPAGTFECYRISEDVETKTLFSVKMKSVSWFSTEAGTVKTETLNQKGKLESKSELTEMKK